MTLPRLVLDTNVLLSALLFHQGSVAWLRHAWQTEELTRVLIYPKFKLTDEDREDLLGDYLTGKIRTERLPNPRVQRPACTFIRCRHPHGHDGQQTHCANQQSVLGTQSYGHIYSFRHLSTPTRGKLFATRSHSATHSTDQPVISHSDKARAAKGPTERSTGRNPY